MSMDMRCNFERSFFEMLFLVVLIKWMLSEIQTCNSTLQFSFTSYYYKNSNIFEISTAIPLKTRVDKQISNNYIPLVNINVVSKLFGKCIKVLINFFINITLQFGFRENKSTIDALVGIFEYVHNCLDKGSKRLGNYFI